MSEAPGDALDAAAALLEQRVGDPEGVAAIGAETLGRLLGGAIAVYARKTEAGERVAPFPAQGPLSPTPTEVCIAVDAMLVAAEVELFELAMWRTWSSVRTNPPEVAGA